MLASNLKYNIVDNSARYHFVPGRFEKGIHWMALLRRLHTMVRIGIGLPPVLFGVCPRTSRGPSCQSYTTSESVPCVVCVQ